MTNEEAISKLKIVLGYCDVQDEDAVQMAIKALEQPEIIRCKDCKHSRFFDPCFYCYEMGGEIIVPENGFCFKAERKINATD